jgi:hypothetical protein
MKREPMPIVQGDPQVKSISRRRDGNKLSQGFNGVYVKYSLTICLKALDRTIYQTSGGS